MSYELLIFLELNLRVSSEGVSFSSLKAVETVIALTQTVPLEVVTPWTEIRPQPKPSLWYTRTRRFKSAYLKIG